VPVGGAVTVTSIGWRPAASLDVVLHSDPIALATVTADATGAMTAQVTIPAGAAVGSHTVTVTGAAPDGSTRELSGALTILGSDGATTAPGGSTTRQELPRTGAESRRLFSSAISLVGAGMLLVIAAKRRRPLARP